MVSASPTDERIAGQLSLSGEAFTFFSFGETTKPAGDTTTTPLTTPKQKGQPSVSRALHHHSASGDGPVP